MLYYNCNVRNCFHKREINKNIPVIILVVKLMDLRKPFQSVFYLRVLVWVLVLESECQNVSVFGFGIGISWTNTEISVFSVSVDRYTRMSTYHYLSHFLWTILQNWDHTGSNWPPKMSDRTGYLKRTSNCSDPEQHTCSGSQNLDNTGYNCWLSVYWIG
jgi:hypothetical protein